MIPTGMFSPSSGHGADVVELGSMWSELEVLYKRRDRRYSPGFCEPDDSGRGFALEYFDEEFERLMPE